MKKHLFFDLDGTICESRQVISYQMFERLSELKLTYDIIVISGAERGRMLEQLNGLKVDYLMAQSGNETSLWKRILSDNEKEKIFQHINKIAIIKPDMIDDRGCQITLSFIGHHANIESKKLFDPTGEKRIAILKETPFESEKLGCTIAGTTCLDYTRKDGTKGKNIERLINNLEWKKENCIYFGDKLGKGGNDESVIGIIECVEVANPTELMLRLNEYAN